MSDTQHKPSVLWWLLTPILPAVCIGFLGWVAVSAQSVVAKIDQTAAQGADHERRITLLETQAQIRWGALGGKLDELSAQVAAVQAAIQQMNADHAHSP